MNWRVSCGQDGYGGIAHARGEVFRRAVGLEIDVFRANILFSSRGRGHQGVLRRRGWKAKRLNADQRMVLAKDALSLQGLQQLESRRVML